MTVVLGPINPNGVVTTSVLGDKLCVLTNITFKGEYKTGGDSSLAPLLESLFKENGRGTIEWVEVQGSPGYMFMWNPETSKLQTIWSGKESAVLKELTEAEYPALIRTGSKPRLFALGR